ncbi:unnamed protein product [Angiostrongylus costaricensis]|uniref:Cwf21 domain-containing protein n=1 Tax=Angiostrongylus costaricensis TaxID=334426 RepID=A0A0R3PI26_ANGCS|nr:unnamed protein product [Angiostrongylus costaricensis]
MKVEQMTAADMKKDIRISELVKELDTAKTRIITLEDLCRSQIGSAVPPAASSFIEVKEQETSNEEPETRDNSQQKKHCGDTVKEAGENKVPSSSNNSTHRVTTSNSRPSLRNIAIMDKDHRIDGKVRPSTASELQSTKHSTLERGENFPVLRGVQVLKDIPLSFKSGQHTDINGDPNDGTKEVVKDSLSDDSDIDITDILETSQKPTKSV